MNTKNELPRRQEPVAIIGIGCRFPGGIRCPRSFWKFLCEGGDGITDVPPDRWNINSYYDHDREKPGKLYISKGGFLNTIALFDPQFFGISPREASFVDPQQRVLLEVAWEAMEDGGIVPESLKGSKVGVFVGVFMHDYENIHCQVTERRLYAAHSATGMSTTIAANRLSYAFDFRGPSLVVDTACSSSLVAVHLACRSILEGESDLALAGGVNMLIRPEMTMVLCKGSFLSPDGYCKSFDARANGYTRSEGAGIVVLKRLSSALRDNDPIYAVISGSAVNQDGRSDGITVPTVDAQVRVINEALIRSGRTAESIQYVEAHGTGTPVGDPIETKAIAAALTRNRHDTERCIIGSVKSNFGHTESAAGVAGLIKTALMLKHGMIPPNLHFETPNPAIPFDDYRLKVPTTLEPWPGTQNGHPRIAGVNSFGFGGTNAHAIVESLPSEPESVSPININRSFNNTTLRLIALSARSPESLVSLAKSSIEYLSSEESTAVTLNDFGYTRALRRGHHPHRLTVAASSKAQLFEHLEAFLNGEKRPGMSTGVLKQKTPKKLAFIFSGMGQQWRGMGRKLYETEPVFRASIEKCDALFRTLTTGWSLIDELTATGNDSRLDETQIVQPCIFSLQTALYALLRSLNVVPDAVVGHSVGEIAAAYAAGILTLEDAVLISYHRSRLQQSKAGQGAMLAVGMTLGKTERLLETVSGSVSVAAVNGPANVTLSGDRGPLEKIASELERDHIFARFLNVDVAFHSNAMDSILPEFKESISGISPREGQIPLVSTVTGKFARYQEISIDYWLRNVRNPVLFADALKELAESGYDLFLEVGAHPVLANSIQDSLAGDGIAADAILPTLRRNEADDIMFYGSLGRLYTVGYMLDWRSLYRDGGQLLTLPGYPWHREHYWIESEESKRARLGDTILATHSTVGRPVHPLLGIRLDQATPTWQTVIDARHPSYLADHVVQKSVVYPGAAYLETLYAAATLLGNAPVEIRDFSIKGPLVLSDDVAMTVQCVANSDHSLSIFSKKAESEQPWNLHASASFGHLEKNVSIAPFAIDELRKRMNIEVDHATCYQRFRSIEIDYGPRFQVIDRVWITGDEAVGLIDVTMTPQLELDEYHIHPVLLDACFQIMASIDTGAAYLPVGIARFTIYDNTSSVTLCRARLTEKHIKKIKGDIALFDEAGTLLAEVVGLCCQRVERADAYQDSIDNMRYEYRWVLDERSAERLRRTTIDYLPSPRTIAETLNDRIASLAVSYDRETFNTVVMPELHALSSHYTVHALRELGFRFGSAGTFTLESVANELGIVPEHRRLFGRLLAILLEDGILDSDGRYFYCNKNPETVIPAECWKKLTGRYPAYHAELSLLNRCGSRLADVLRGKEDPLSLIFPVSSLLTEHLYHDSPSFRFYNRLMQLVMDEIVHRMPDEQPLRILEIGAGTGAMAQQLLRILPAHRTRYVFTDISRAFTSQAEQKFRSPLTTIDFAVLDIEKNPEDQGFDCHSFDIVIASDVLHATADLRRTLTNIRSLLSPGGLLLLLEITTAHRWFDLVFGMLSGWWLFGDKDIRPSSPLIKSDAWLSLLSSLGFADALAIPGKEGERESQHSIIIARANGIVENDTAVIPRETTELTGYETDFDGRPWLIIGDNDDVSRRILETLRKRGISPVIVTYGDRFDYVDSSHYVLSPVQSENYVRLLDTVTPDLSLPPVIINLIGLETPYEQLSCAVLERTTNEECARVLVLLQTLMSREWTVPPDFWMITGGVESPEGCRESSLAESPVWGLARVMTTEFANLHTRTADIGLSPTDRDIAQLCELLLAPDSEDELMIHKGNRYVRRLIRLDEHGESGPPKEAFRLHTARTKGVDSMAYHAFSRRKPGYGEVEVEVCASGLNFKDVAKITGLLDTTPLANRQHFESLGMECSGVITAIGEGVEGFSIGEEIMGVLFDSLASHTITDPRALVHKPSTMSFEEAATIPVVFLTSAYALTVLAGIRKGNRVLIHSAAGGIGLSAIQIARAAGAEIFATAGTTEKRDYLASLGISYVGDSRSLSFADEIMALTGNEGVDVILNTLPAKTIPTSMSLLKPVTGTFIDLSNMYEPALMINTTENGVSFHSFDLEMIVQYRPDIIRNLWVFLLDGFAQGIYTPLPYRAFPLSDTVNAFRHMRKGSHIGKVIVTMNDPDIVPVPTRDSIEVRDDGVYLISGGLGGFGLAVARWLVECGAKYLVLLGRRGASSPEAQAVVESLRNAGATIAVERVDVTDEKQIRDCFATLNKTMPPLRGIIHAAMVLEDSPLIRMTAEQIKKTLDPKILGAWNLHVASEKMKLDFFICFSSIASLVGNADQGNYVAANYFLEALTRYRAARGLPALAINWGPIAGAGYVAVHDEIRDHLTRQGVMEIPLSLAWQSIADALDKNLTQVGIITADWDIIRKYSISVAKSPRFSQLVRRENVMDESKAEMERIALSASLSPEERRAMIIESVAREVAAVLGISRAKLETGKPLDLLGIDSLMAVELVIGLEKATTISLPKMVVLRPGLTVDELIDIVEKELAKQHPPTMLSVKSVRSEMQTSIPRETSPKVHDNDNRINIDSLSDEEVDSMLNSLMSGDDNG